MRKWINNLNPDWSLIALAYIAARSIFALSISWAEIIGIAIVLLIHYCKRLIPKQKTLVQFENDFLGMMRDIETNHKMLSADVSNLKLAAGMRKEKSF